MSCQVSGAHVVHHSVHLEGPFCLRVRCQRGLKLSKEGRKVIKDQVRAVLLRSALHVPTVPSVIVPNISFR